jgi:Tfp pilus assembly protein PilF
MQFIRVVLLELTASVALTVLVSECAFAAQNPNALQMGQQALDALKQNDITHAKQLIDKALLTQPHEVVLLEVAALVAERAHQDRQALAYLSESAQLEPRNERVAMERAGFECRHGLSTLGERHFKDLAAQFEASASTALLAAAQCAERAHDDVLAAVDYQQLLSQDSDNADAMLGLARLDYTRARYHEAQEQLERLLSRIETPSEEALVLMIKTQRALNHTASAVRYEADLLKQFPESKALMELKQNGGAR